jgi:hypothetical protein
LVASRFSPFRAIWSLIVPALLAITAVPLVEKWRVGAEDVFAYNTTSFLLCRF